MTRPIQNLLTVAFLGAACWLVVGCGKREPAVPEAKRSPARDKVVPLRLRKLARDDRLPPAGTGRPGGTQRIRVNKSHLWLHFRWAF